MVTVSIISLVILIFILHTILTYLLNWLFRIIMDKDEKNLIIFPVIFTFLEVIVCISLLKYFIK